MRDDECSSAGSIFSGAILIWLTKETGLFFSCKKFDLKQDDGVDLFPYGARTQKCFLSFFEKRYKKRLFLNRASSIFQTKTFVFRLFFLSVRAALTSDIRVVAPENIDTVHHIPCPDQ